MFAAVNKGQAETSKASEPTTTIEAVTQPASEDTPAKPIVPTDEIETRLERALRATQAKEKEAYELSQRLKDFEAKLKERDEAEQKRLTNPLVKLALEGKSYEEITRAIIAGELDAPSPEALAQQETKSELQVLKEKLAAIENEKVQAQERAELTAKATQLETELKQNIQHFPVLASVGWGAQEILRLSKLNPDTSITEIARELEKRASRDVRAVFTSDASLKALLADPDIKSRVSRLLDTKTTQLAQQEPTGDKGTRNKPDAIPASKASNPGTRKVPAKVTKQDRLDRAMRAVENNRRNALGK
jgi:hypothetical protein